MGIGVLWIPALAGYLFLTRFNGTRFTLLRSTGYQFVLRAAVAGIVLYVIATSIAYVGDAMCPVLSSWWTRLFPVEYSGTVAISFVIGLTAPSVLNRLPYYDKFKAQRNAAFEDGDQIGLLVDQAIQRKEFIELTLSNSKSYVGKPVHGTFGFRDTGDVLVIPIFSGYRHTETQELELTTNYGEVILALVEKKPPEARRQILKRFSVAVPIRDIVSVRIFDLEVYREHFETE